MKRNCSFFLLGIAVFVFTWNNFSAAAKDALPADVTPDLIAQGKQLFNHKEGLKVKFACILCHKQEKAIKKSSLAKIGDKLPAVINKHITEKSKGNAIPADSQEMKALMAYIRYEHSK